MFSKTPLKLAVVNAAGMVISRMEVTSDNANKFFPLKEGKRIIGPNVRRLLSIKEIIANGLAASKNKAGDLLRDTPHLACVPLEETLKAA